MRTFIVFIALLFASVVMAQAYRWVDEDGVVHYSDRPQEGAEEIQLPGTTPRTGRYIPQAVPRRRASNEEVEPFRYESIEFTSPRPEETLWNIEGVLQVSLVLRPSLQPGHRLRVTIDGQTRTVVSTTFQVQDVYRGVHNIRAEVLDRAGQSVGKSTPSLFYVQQNTILHH